MKVDHLACFYLFSRFLSHEPLVQSSFSLLALLCICLSSSEPTFSWIKPLWLGSCDLVKGFSWLRLPRWEIQMTENAWTRRTGETTLLLKLRRTHFLAGRMTWWVRCLLHNVKTRVLIPRVLVKLTVGSSCNPTAQPCLTHRTQWLIHVVVLWLPCIHAHAHTRA